MKRPLQRTVVIDETRYDVEFLYWPSIPPSRTTEGESAEIQILSLRVNNKPYPVPLIFDDGGNGEYEKISEAVINDMALQEELSQVMFDQICL